MLVSPETPIYRSRLRTPQRKKCQRQAPPVGVAVSRINSKSFSLVIIILQAAKMEIHYLKAIMHLQQQLEMYNCKGQHLKDRLHLIKLHKNTHCKITNLKIISLKEALKIA